MLTPDRIEGRIISILSDGKFHEKVAADTEGAVLRQYETSSGEKGEKWELVYKKIEAYITKIDFQDGEYGENLLIWFNDGENALALSVSTSSNFGEDILKKLPALDFSEKVGMQPYSFTKENGKEARGVSVWQKTDKVQSFFRDFEKNEDINGIPQPEGDTSKYDKDDWRIHFIKVRKFLVAYAKEHIVPKLDPENIAKEMDYPSDEIDPKSIPF